MDKREFATFVMALKTYYPRENLLPNQQAMELWYQELSDLPYNVANAALRQFVHTNKLSPSISELRALAATTTNGIQKDWGEAWGQVERNIKKYGACHYDENRLAECKASFDQITRQVVERLGWKQLCMSENPVADRANFRTIYEQLAEREKREQQMPHALRLDVDNIRQMKALQEQAKQMQIETKQ